MPSLSPELLFAFALGLLIGLLVATLTAVVSSRRSRVRSETRLAAALLAPLQDSLARVQSTLDASAAGHTADSKALRDALDSELARVERLVENVGNDARGLKSALRGNVNFRGQWGETVLSDMLEDSGLLPGRQFDLQPVYPARDGANVRPDAVVRCPDGAALVIDAKTTFPEYFRYTEAATPEERKAAFLAHLQTLRRMVQGLAARRYSDLVPDSAPFTLLFLPLEGAYQLTLHRAPEFIRSTLAEKKILLVGPSNFFVLLTLVRSLWSRSDQERNTREILETAAELVRRAESFSAILSRVGESIDAARDAYEAAQRQLASPDKRSRSIASLHDTLKDLGVSR